MNYYIDNKPSSDNSFRRKAIQGESSTPQQPPISKLQFKVDLALERYDTLRGGNHDTLSMPIEQQVVRFIIAMTLFRPTRQEVAAEYHERLADAYEKEHPGLNNNQYRDLATGYREGTLLINN